MRLTSGVISAWTDRYYVIDITVPDHFLANNRRQPNGRWLVDVVCHMTYRQWRLHISVETLQRRRQQWSFPYDSWYIETLSRKMSMIILPLLQKQESCAIAKMTAKCALYVGALNIFGTPWLHPRLHSQHFSWAFVPIDPVNVVPRKIEVRSFTRSWDNSEYPKDLDSPWIRLCFIFCKILNGL